MSPALNWATGHWREEAAPCRHCGRPTHLVTTDGRPAHKVCEELAPDGEIPPTHTHSAPTRRRRR